jgi:ribosome-associated protein
MSYLIEQLKRRPFHSEWEFRTSRSSRPGGQNVNKVSSKVELRFDIDHSSVITEDEKELIRNKLASKITIEGILIIVSQENRSQLKNKEAAIHRFFSLLASALQPVKKRRPTKRTRASVERRLERKKQQSAKKADRRFKA